MPSYIKGFQLYWVEYPKGYLDVMGFDENGSCGEGPLDDIAVFNSFKSDNFCKCLLEEDIQLGNYQSHPTIKALLSN